MRRHAAEREESMKRKQSDLRNRKKDWKQKVSRIRQQTLQARRQCYRRGPRTRLRHG